MSARLLFHANWFIVAAFIFVFTWLWLLSGYGAMAANKAGTPDVHKLEAAYALSKGSSKLEAQEAYFNGEQFFINYKVGDDILFSGGTWTGEVRPGIQNEDPDAITVPPILPLQSPSILTWKDKPEKLKPLRILSSIKWDAFRGDLRAFLAPKDGIHGTVIDFLNEEEYFIYYDKDGTFKSTLIQDKPPEIRVQKSYRFDELLQLTFPVLEDYLKKEGIESRQIVFNTGDFGMYSFPFFYADLDNKEVLFLRLVPDDATTDTTIFEGKRAQMAGHIVRSHVGGAVVRPFSSLHRLVFLVTDTGVDTIRWTSLAGISDEPVPPISGKPGMDLNAWEMELDKLTGSKPSKGTIRYLVDGEEYFPRLIDEIIAAKESIDIRTYIFDNDDYATKIADILKKRSGDVNVRVLLDGIGTILATTADPKYLPMKQEAPLSVRSYLTKDSKIKIRQLTNPWLAGDHVKTTIIDNKLAFMGGMNIGREYRYEWHDLMLQIEGPVVDIMREEFNKTWAHSGTFGDLGRFAYRLKPKKEKADDVGFPVRVLFTRAGDSEIFNAQLRAIRKAQSYIYIQNAYFSDDAILYELVKARRRGVDVRIIIPLKGNHGVMNNSNVLAANTMIANGIRVFIYQGMTHVKAAVYDGWACMGSANFDKMSFRINEEMNLATSHQETVNQLLKQVFTPDFEKSIELKEPFPEKWSDYLAELIADQL